jgi:hypothetical protein
MNGSHRERLLESLRRSLVSGNLENVKRAADSLQEAGGDSVAELSGIALNESATLGEREMALRALESLDSSTLRLVERIRSSGGTSQPQKVASKPPQTRETTPLPDPGKTLIFGFLTALAILWPAYSIYRFNNPRPQKPPEPKLPWTDQEIRIESLTACRSVIRQQLRDPSSVDFPFLDSPIVEVSYSGRVDVKGYLHANNGLGLKVRADYICALQADRQARTMSVLSAQLSQR